MIKTVICIFYVYSCTVSMINGSRLNDLYIKMFCVGKRVVGWSLPYNLRIVLVV